MPLAAASESRPPIGIRMLAWSSQVMIVWSREEDRKRITEFCHNGKEEPRAAIARWQSYSKGRKEIDEIDSEMALVPELPKDFDDFVDREVLPQYLFYDAGRKVTKGHCTHCGREVKIRNPHYGDAGECPSCKHPVTYRSRKKGGNVNARGYAGLLQKTKEGYVYRYFECYRKFRNGQKENGGTLIEKLHMEKYVEDFVKNARSVDISSPTLTKKDRVQYAKKQVIGTFKKVFPYILIGVGIGAVIHNWIPESWIESVLGSRNPFGVILATLVGIPMYADIFGTIPVAEALLSKGAELGTILSFMMAVTTLSLPSLIMLKKVVKPKLLVLFIGICTAAIW